MSTELPDARLSGINAANAIVFSSTSTAALTSIIASALGYLDTVGTAEIDDEAVTLPKMAHMATTSLLGRSTASTGGVEVLDKATVLSMLDLVIGNDVQAYLAAHVLGSITFGIDGEGSAITTGLQTARVRIAYDCTITSAELTADQSGSIVVDVWKDSYADFPPTVSDTIVASAKPTLSSAIKSQDATLTGWSLSLTAGDYLYFNVDSASAVEFVLVSLPVTKN